MRTADHDLTAIVLVACVDEPVALAIVRVVRWARLVWGAGVDDAPLGLIHDVGFALLRGHGLRLCGGRERIALDGFVDDRERELLRAIRLRFEDRVLTNLARDPSVQAAHVVIAGTRAAGQDVVIAHALTALLPRLLAKRDWPAQVIGRLRDLTDTNDSIADDLAALLADVDGEDIVAAGAVLDAIDDAVAPALAPEALWELARLDDVPSPAARLALRTVHKTMAALPSPSTSLLTRLQDRRHDVIIDDEHAADVFPAGGFDGMSTRGTFENLVRSEVAYVGVGADDTAGSGAGAPDLFDVRFVEGELLYYTRDESPLLERRRQLCVVIEEAPRLRHKLAELPTQTLVLCEACVLRAFADLQLAFGASGGVIVQDEVSNGDFATEVHMRKRGAHEHGRLHRLARRQVQEVDVGQVGFVCQIRRDHNRQPLRVRRARCAVRAQSLEQTLGLHHLGVRGHDFGGLAVQTQTDALAQRRSFLDGAR